MKASSQSLNRASNVGQASRVPRAAKRPERRIRLGRKSPELSPHPAGVSQFFTRYQDRILYGTDMNPDPEMYRVTFRLLETADEHFYPAYFRKYHWPMHAWALPEAVLKKIYRDNALRLLSAEKTLLR